MFLPWFGFVSAALAIAAFFLVHRGLAEKPVRSRLLTTLALIPVALPGASFALYYLHLVDEPSWYYEFRSWRGSELFLIGVGAIGGAVGTFFPGISRAVALAGVVAFVTVPFLKPILGPLDHDLLSETWTGDVCLQSVPSTCGAASSATILTRLGTPTSEREIAEEAFTYAYGTEAWYLARAVRRRGFEVHFRSGIEIESIELPAIVGTTIAGVGHFVPFLERNGDGSFTIGDPLRGPETLKPDLSTARFELTGWAMEISPPSGK